MFIAVNAQSTTFSVRRSGRQNKHTTQVDFRSSERRRKCSSLQSINISPLTGRRRHVSLIRCNELRISHPPATARWY